MTASIRTTATRVGLLTSTLALCLVAAPTAVAAETEDDRAQAFDGNATRCDGGPGQTADLNLAGTEYGLGDSAYTAPAGVITFAQGTPNSDQYLDITAVAAGFTVTGVVVKGGPGYNLYLPTALGTLPWLDLVSPLNAGNQLPTISHWFACVVTTPTPTPIVGGEVTPTPTPTPTPTVGGVDVPDDDEDEREVDGVDLPAEDAGRSAVGGVETGGGGSA